VGVLNLGGSVEVTHRTIAQNEAVSGFPARGIGLANIRNIFGNEAIGEVSITNSTIRENRLLSSGGIAQRGWYSE
jgi:hypothetical protein